MTRLKLSEWAQIGEIVGMIGVVLSLLIVAYSVSQNTEALQGSTDNMIFERHSTLAEHFISDPTFAEILVKKRSGDPQLNEVELIRWEKYQLNMLDIWATAYNRNQKNLLDDYEWQAWDEYFTGQFSADGERIDRDFWEQYEYGFGASFWAHVERSLLLKD
jgi:hypothetical protein